MAAANLFLLRPTRDDENEMIAELLVGLSNVHKAWRAAGASCPCATSKGMSGTTSGFGGSAANGS